MPATVVVLLPAVDARGPDARALTAACTAALREGECVVRDSAPETAIAVATVTVRGAGKVHIDVDVRATGAAPARHPSRDLTFRDADPMEERWKSVGFAIASMSGAAVDVEPAPAPSSAAPPGGAPPSSSPGGAPPSSPPGGAGQAGSPGGAPPSSSPGGALQTPPSTASGAAPGNASGAPAGDAKSAATPATPAPKAAAQTVSASQKDGPPTRTPPRAPPSEDEAERRHRFRASGELETGPGLTRGTWRLGGALGLGYDFDDGFWAIDALAGYAGTPTDVNGVDVSWLTFGAGASVAFAMYGVQGRLGALLGARELAASGTDARTGQHQALTRWLPMGIARASLRWPASAALGMFSGLELRRVSGGTAIQNHDTYIGSSAAFELGLFLGVEVRP